MSTIALASTTTTARYMASATTGGRSKVPIVSAVMAPTPGSWKITST